MSVSALYKNPSANVIRSLLQHTHELSIYAKDMPYALKAHIVELNLSTGRLVLEVDYAGSDIEDYLVNGGVSFDLEALKGVHATERETYSLSSVAANLIKMDSALYRLECQLPESVFVQENRGARYAFPLFLACRPASISKFICMNSTFRPGCAIYPWAVVWLTSI
ncbi:hypothetical protein [Vreelandella neptunia]|uniref:Uncharacterized protein n=1 Tax=Vreelandella neptunia TaxID=115551 RepID=A0ABS9S6C8_9GAMM|nr:hypothetical protein [Halomonas neptunia]MCH4811667.1 hypothetical protein [Halomonas neptunia]